MNNPQQLITENLNIWTAAIKKRGSQGRGSSKKIELYGIKKLRGLILDLAVNGLLIDCSKDTLLFSAFRSNVDHERTRIAVGNKSSSLKLIPNYESIKAPVPKNFWITCRVNELFVTTQGVQISKDLQSEQKQDGFNRYLYISDFKHDEKLKYVEDKYPAKRVTLNDLVMANTGSPGEVYHGVEGILSNNLFKISFNNEIFDKDFIYLFFKSPTFINTLSTQLKGAAQQHLGHKLIGSQFISFPQYIDQSRIVAKVDELMALCDQLEQQTEDSLAAHQTLVETLLKSLLDAAQTTPGHASSAKSIQQNQNENQKDKINSDPFQQAWQMIWENFDALFTTEHSIDQLKQTILQLAVMGKLVPQNPNDEPASVLLEKIAAEKEQLIKDGKIKKQKALPEISEDEKPFELPKGWAWVRFGNIAHLITDGAHHTPTYTEEGVPFLSVKDMSSGKLNFKDTRFISKEQHIELSKRCCPSKGDLLLTKIGTTGVPVIIDTDIEFSIFVSVALIKFSKDMLLGDYLSLMIKSPVVKNQSKAGTQGVGNKNLVLKTIAIIMLVIPPLEEQYRIVAKVDELMALCDTLKKRIRESQTTQLHLADAMAEQALNE